MTDAEARKRKEARRRHNEAFVKRLMSRRPVTETVDRGPPGMMALDAATPDSRGAVLETIVFRERPVLFVEKAGWINKTEVTTFGPEAEQLVRDLDGAQAALARLLPLVGRIDVMHYAGAAYLGTGWFIAPGIVVTNRHVAERLARHDGERFVFRAGVGGTISSSLGTGYEWDATAQNPAQVYPLTEVLYIEGERGADIAFLRAGSRAPSGSPTHITLAPSDATRDTKVVAVGYPARAPSWVISDQELMQQLYRGRYDVKRIAPGLALGAREGSLLHDCTTLGGNSGSVVLGLDGAAVGLHFAGLYQEENYAVPASVLADYVRREAWRLPPVAETRERAPAQPIPQAAAPGPAMQGDVLKVWLPLEIRIGAPMLDNGMAALANARAPSAEEAVKRFWDLRPDGVVAVRVGYDEAGGEIGERPLIAASVRAGQLAEIASKGPRQFQGWEVRYFAADVAEQVDALAVFEVADSIAYDDDARKTAGFSLRPIEEEMTVLAHLGPEYSWDVLKAFLTPRSAGESRWSGMQSARKIKSLVSAMYEFHGPHIADAVEAVLAEGASLRLVVDNVTFSKVKDEELEFDRVERFESWASRFGTKFHRIIAPEGGNGLISDSYHIKVTVRDDDTFWLSSGNWKKGSSQPVVTDDDRRAAATEDIAGNREWHVVIHNQTLAERFRNHITQDFKRSEELDGRVLPKRLDEFAGLFVDVPIIEEAAAARRAPGRVIEPKLFTGVRKVQPLLTPDREGAVYSDAVLHLIQSATSSLLFQIPYIAMPSDPRADRGYIDALLEALTEKLLELDDARLLLRTGSSKYSSPQHAAWYLKSKGVDIASRVKVIADSHTKGMVVDGERVLIGSHNWSKSGVSLNRDASLIFDDREIAAYYADAFEIDWKRASRITPRKYVKPELVVTEAIGLPPPPGYRRVPLSELMKEDD